MINFNLKVWLPLIIMLVLAGGIYVGSRMNIGTSSMSLFSIKYTERDKLNDVINYINSDYVDKVDKQELTEKSINGLLSTLDPHSSYIPPRDMNAVEESMMGNFFGIGVQFRSWKDSVVVVKAMEGGPSLEAGIMAGDRLIAADGNTLIGIDNDSIMKLLKGPRGSVVKVLSYRPSDKQTYLFKIIRDAIPYNSIVSSYLIDDSIAYIKISRFAATTYDEFIKDIKEMSLMKITDIIIDLQGNGGGLLSAATSLTDEFLPKGNIIVYTEGRKKREKETFLSTKNQILKGKRVIVMVDENSASASEIFAGAIQDNDRGTIIGRRTFGKGLVQEQINLPDNSAIRLTVARYYTATGRCIQKPYNNGINEYYHELAKRFDSGEMYNADSASFPDSLKHLTAKGKIVYGGGGIWPDIFVAVDTSLNFWFYNQIQRNGVLPDFTFAYFDANRIDLLKDYPTDNDFVDNFIVTKSVEASLMKKAKEANSIMPKKMDAKMMGEIKLSFKAQLASDLYGSNAYFKVMNSANEIYQKALESIRTSSLVN